MNPEGFKSGEIVINNLKGDAGYRFLGASERLLQEEKLALQRSTKTYLQRHPKCRDNTDGADVPRDKIKSHLKKASLEGQKNEVIEKRWQGKLPAARREDDQLNQRGGFAWLKNWDMAPTHTIAGMLEIYEQLTPTKVYHACKTHTHQPVGTLCRFCGKTAESIPHALASCSALAQNKYLDRHNAALKVLFWEMLRRASVL